MWGGGCLREVVANGGSTAILYPSLSGLYRRRLSQCKSAAFSVMCIGDIFVHLSTCYLALFKRLKDRLTVKQEMSGL